MAAHRRPATRATAMNGCDTTVLPHWDTVVMDKRAPAEAFTAEAASRLECGRRSVGEEGSPWRLAGREPAT